MTLQSPEDSTQAPDQGVTVGPFAERHTMAPPIHFQLLF